MKFFLSTVILSLAFFGTLAQEGNLVEVADAAVN